MIEPPLYSPHPAGTAVVTTTEDIHVPSPPPTPPPDYQSVVMQDEPVGLPFSQERREEHNGGIQVVATIDILPPLPEYQREPGSESPPSYESLFGRVKAAQQSSSSTFVFCSSLCKVILSSAFCMIVLAVLSALPIAEIVIGSMYMDECPVAKYVPVYLVVIGAVCLVKFLSIVCQNIHDRQNEDQRNSQTNGFDQILNIFLLVWFILGNRWVYGAHTVWVSDPASALYCHPTLYYFAYWSITSFYIFCGAACLGMCVMTCICGNNRAQR
ncbi:uncharacterized protein LOC117316850 [Pecten maximus]|uniref:uncharacterized protein LOC117316850 n=1 Tax=Pecten maximus TaxID=6579 RepID=UPI0014582A0B|nr:uncharacterized protein LOC117316850 [Pecten maximus]XP_033727522.1 uncharacterized protein LOC117316850 [Pecten maximus]